MGLLSDFWMLESPERLNLQFNYRLDCRVLGLLDKKTELFYVGNHSVVPQKWCKYNFGVYEESTLVFSRNVDSKESCNAALNHCKIKCRGERERSTWKRLVTLLLLFA